MAIKIISVHEQYVTVRSLCAAQKYRGIMMYLYVDVLKPVCSYTSTGLFSKWPNSRYTRLLFLVKYILKQLHQRERSLNLV